MSAFLTVWFQIEMIEAVGIRNLRTFFETAHRSSSRTDPFLGGSHFV